MGDKISIRVVDATGQSSTQMVESGIKLTVTPHITGDNRIMLELKPENNSYSYDDKGQPVISTQDAETKVVVADGETVVIGGLTKNIETESETGVPFLKDIPVLGYLFKYYKKEVTKKDLIIFVTPRILRNQMQEIQQLGEQVKPAVESKPVVETAPTEAKPVVEQPQTQTPATTGAADSTDW
jgi:type II secretory pathway component GspD/PulD (secretin)